MQTERKLMAAGVKYTTKPVFSNFFGRQYNFPTLKEAQVTGHTVHGKAGNYHFTLY